MNASAYINYFDFPHFKKKKITLAFLSIVWLYIMENKNEKNCTLVNGLKYGNNFKKKGRN